MKEPIERAAEVCGSVTALAEKLGYSVQVVSNWRTRGVPIPMCPALESVTKGAVMRWDLRPDDWHRIWPELAAHPNAPKVAA